MEITPRPLIILHPEQPVRETLQRASRKRFHMTLVDDWDELKETVSQAPPAAVIVVDPYVGQEPGDGPSPHLYKVLKAFPSVALLSAVETRLDRHRDVSLLTDWGVSEILQVEEETSPAAVRRRLLMARAQYLHRLLSHDYGVVLTGRARSLMDAAVDTVMAGGHPRDLAKKLGFSQSTLLRWCQRSQLPNPRRLLLWMRMLLAAALLDDPGHSVFSVGRACGYSGDQALRRALRSVIPMTPSELREAGAFETVSRAFFEELAELRDDRADKR